MKPAICILLFVALLGAQATKPAPPAPMVVKKIMNHYTKVVNEKEIHVHCIPGTHVSSSRQTSPTTIIVVCESNQPPAASVK